ncbi:DUF2247 family protein [Bacillus pumilus]|uniref:DUF2247 family protein n=1 Tax=Bacillus TaxID=1386 RepID=UPI000D028FAE|nr:MULTISPECIES: DUF2247 family protein [Bacillus]MBR0622538.1 DUF2247 family protein [Bacillus pumilus]MCK6165301.1 DUF2247 family protein [Bacillus pumilus]MCK6185807.1 DUF2247 family protein [Bacillus pumilus]MCW6699946.1 DUF2247 family protein [Bacillus sp. RP12]PRS48857.1 DUF2247 domain-containing protein [Bacillus sp. LNXM10]
MYKIEIITKNGFDCNWSTLFVGRQFNLISALEVTNYAVKYLENNPNANNELILELAWEQEEVKVDNILESIISDNSSEDMEREYHKWLYSTMKETYSNSTDENIFEEIENIFAIFNTPENMYDFFRKVSDAFYYPHDSQNTIKELVEKFLEAEKELIFK